MQTFRSHGLVGEAAPPRERLFGGPPRGHYGRYGRYGRGDAAARGGFVDPPPAQACEERYWVDQDFEEPFLE